MKGLPAYAPAGATQSDIAGERDSEGTSKERPVGSLTIPPASFRG